MRLLLDTHSLLWVMLDPKKLKAETRVLLADPANSLVVGISTLWEITIKAALGKIAIPGSDIAPIVDQLDSFRIGTLPIRPEHLIALQKLPRIHRDPFDRILIAQSQVEGIPLVTVDKDIRKYPVQFL